MARRTGRVAARQRGSSMVQGYPDWKDASADGERANAPLLTVPRAIVRGRDGRSRWVAQCPRCVERHEEGLIVGHDESSRAPCKTCGAIVEVRESGVSPIARTLAPPED